MAQLPPDMRAALPASEGEPQVEIVWALFRHEHTKPNEVRWTEVRELTAEDWDAVIAAHGEIYMFTRGFDGFLSFAWGDLRNAVGELQRQMREQAVPDEWMMRLIEYRILGYSTALKLYQEQVMAQVNRNGNEELKVRVAKEFSEVYDRSFGYRLIYSMRNAFQHGVHGLVAARLKARLLEGSDTKTEANVHAYLVKESFGASRANATVRRQVREMNEEIDLFQLSDESYDEVQRLHTRLAPLLHPAAPAAAQLLIQYINELGGDRPHFHEYIRGLPTKGLLGITTLDRVGFEYVAKQAGVEVAFEEGTPSDALAVLPVYSPHKYKS